jgi:hypothetical protein
MIRAYWDIRGNGEGIVTYYVVLESSTLAHFVGWSDGKNLINGKNVWCHFNRKISEMAKEPDDEVATPTLTQEKMRLAIDAIFKAIG